MAPLLVDPQTIALTEAQAAELLGVTVEALTAWRHERIGPDYLILPDPSWALETPTVTLPDEVQPERIRYRRADLDEWCERRRFCMGRLIASVSKGCSTWGVGDLVPIGIFEADLRSLRRMAARDADTGTGVDDGRL